MYKSGFAVIILCNDHLSTFKPRKILFIKKNNFTVDLSKWISINSLWFWHTNICVPIVFHYDVIDPIAIDWCNSLHLPKFIFFLRSLGLLVQYLLLCRLSLSLQSYLLQFWWISLDSFIHFVRYSKRIDWIVMQCNAMQCNVFTTFSLSICFVCQSAWIKGTTLKCLVWIYIMKLI